MNQFEVNPLRDRSVLPFLQTHVARSEWRGEGRVQLAARRSITGTRPFIIGDPIKARARAHVQAGPLYLDENRIEQCLCPVVYLAPGNSGLYAISPKV